MQNLKKERTVIDGVISEFVLAAFYCAAVLWIILPDINEL